MKFIPIANPNIGNDEAIAAFKVIKKGWISMGKEVSLMEKEASKILKNKNVLLFNNGTSCLHAVLLALGIKKDDEVIVPSLSYISSSNAVLYVGGKPVFCDSDVRTFNTNFFHIEKKITKKTRAIITVDLKGMPIDYDSIKKKLKKYNIPLISDSAESFGAIYKKQIVGSQFDFHTFSFFANKNITMGEGGLISCKSKKMYNKLKIIRNQGQTRRYNHVILGNNFRPTDYAAAIGRVQLRKLNSVLRKKNSIAKFYNNNLKNIDQIETPYVPKYVSRHSWYNYCILLKNLKIKKKFKKFLIRNKIDFRESFPPIHDQPMYLNIIKNNTGLKNCKEAFNRFIDLPIWSNLNIKQTKYIVRKIKFFFDNE
jgi:perosamine synthetase